MKPKNFTLVAGPNGAGKSSLSNYLSRPNAIIFDPDKEFKKLEEQMPDLPDENLYHALDYTLDNFINKALGERLDFTIESNLRDNKILETVNKFKEHEYVTSLIFIALGSIEESQKRVTQRIKEQGHAVDSFSIAYNFEYSKKTLFSIIDQFDFVLVLESIQDAVNPLLRLLNKKIVLERPATKWGKILQQELKASLLKRDS